MTDFVDLEPAAQRITRLAAALPDRLDALVAACLGFVGASAQPEGVPELFGPIVPVPEDAPEFDRLLGLSGRDPAWSPPA